MMNKVKFTCAPMFNNNKIFSYACTTKKNIENFYANNRGYYDPNTYYLKDDQITYMGIMYQAVSDGAQEYQPDISPNIWQLISSESVSSISVSSEYVPSESTSDIPSQSTSDIPSESVYVPPESVYVPPESVYVAAESVYVPPESVYVPTESESVYVSTVPSETVSAPYN